MYWSVNQGVHANNFATTTLGEATNVAITQTRDDINGFQNKVTSTFWEFEKSDVANKEDLNRKVVVNLLNNRLYQLENVVQNNRNHLNAVETTLEAVEDKVQAV